jgi:biopolymer transport protein ExbD
MAEISIPGEKKHAGVRRSKKLSTRVDLTPMVDLGFLLITFFIFTTTMARPTSLHLALPADGPPSQTGKTNTLTIIPVAGNKVFYYHGDLNEAMAAHQYGTTNFSITEGIGRVIRDKRQALEKSGRFKAKDLVLIIKPDASASYRAVVDALDETLINDVTRYAFTDLSREEKEALVSLHVL